MAKSKTILEVSQNINKKGRLKGKTKKQTKMLKAKCVHARLNKEGKIRPTIHPVGKGVFECKICKARFHAKPASKEEIEEVISKLIDRINFAKYAAVAINADPKTVDYLANLNVGVKSFKKTYKKLTAIVKKRDTVSKKKRKGSRYNNSEYGSWT